MKAQKAKGHAGWQGGVGKQEYSTRKAELKKAPPAHQWQAAGGPAQRRGPAPPPPPPGAAQPWKDDGTSASPVERAKEEGRR